jgi:allophanate hydrolase subunit 1
MQISPCGDGAIKISLPSTSKPSFENLGKLINLKREIDSLKLQGLLEIVTGFDSITIIFDPLVFSINELIGKIPTPSYNSSIKYGKTHEIPICFCNICALDKELICK